MFENTFLVLLEKGINLDDCLQWYQEPSRGPPEGMAEALNFDAAHMEILRLELPLLLLDFIREQSSKILQASQIYSQTPSKTNHPSKYDYTSPVKTLKKTVQLQISSEQRGNKKRVQLFASPQSNKTGALSSSMAQLQLKPVTVELSDDLIFQKLGGDVVDPKMAYLEDRLSTPVGKSVVNHGSNDKLKIGQFENNNSGVKINSRRSLNSVPLNLKPSKFVPPHKRGPVQEFGGDLVDPEMAYFEEQESTPLGKSVANHGSNDKLKIGQFENNDSGTKINPRRSLDSVALNSKPLKFVPPHKRGSGGNLSFGDFLTISTNGSKKPKSKYKKQKSDSALLDQKREIPLPELPRQQILEEPRCELFEEPDFCSQATRITATPQKLSTATPQKPVKAEVGITATPRNSVDYKSSDLENINAAAFDSEITAVDNDISALESDTPALESEVTAVESEVTAVESEVTAAESEATAVESEPAACNSVVRSFNCNVIDNGSRNEERASPLRIVRPNFERCESLSEFVEPDPTKVTYGSSLSKLATLYSYFIEHHQVPNVLVELYLLLELLTVKALEEGDDDETSGIFCTIHNCAFFAAQVLKSQVELLQFTDTLTLKYLENNSRLDIFCPEIKSKLNSYLDENQRLNKRHGSGGNKFQDSQIQSVRFQTETDAKENFPTSQTFQDFRKQRDQFYEILRDWQQPAGGASHGDVFGPRVSKLLCLQTHPVNMIHFAQLFQSQLLNMSLSEKHNHDLEDSSLLEEFDMLNKLKVKDPVKLRRLQERLVTPSRFGGPCPSPDFSGCQEFFRDFLRSCGGNHMFLTHLKSTLVASITEINEKNFVENHFSASSRNDSTSYPFSPSGVFQNDDLYNSILSLKILAKFLGFIESLPHQYREDSLSDKLMEISFKNRLKEVPCIDLIGFLKKSQRDGNLVITLPWIIDFCSVLDSITVKLPYYQQLFGRMLSIYQNDLIPEIQSENQSLNRIKRRESINTTTDEEGEELEAIKASNRLEKFNAFFLTVHMGWFFEGLRFPRELFIADNKNSIDKNVKNDVPSRTGIDSMPCLKRSILYTCCPYVSELKVILSQFLTGFKATRQQIMLEHSSSSESVPSIPERQGPRLYQGSISSRAQVNRVRFRPEPAADRTKKTMSELQSELEENFFHNQSASFKQCVEFVADRVASNLIRIFTRDVIPDESLRVTQELWANMSLFMSELNDKNMAKTIKEELLSQVKEFSEKSFKSVRRQTNQIIKSRVALSCSTTVGPLLPDDTHPTVAQLSVTVATKKAAVLCKQWVKEYVTKDYFMKEYTRELDKLWKSALKKAGILEGNVKEETTGPRIHIEEKDKNMRDNFSYDALIKMKDQTVALLETKGRSDVVNESVLGLLSDLERALANEVAFYNGDISDLELTLRGVEVLSVDWTVALCAFAPQHLISDVFDTLIGIWGGSRPSSDIKTHFSFRQPPPQLNTLISPRNLTILGQSQRPDDSWKKFENLLGRLLKAKLVLPLAVEDQCIAILRREWHPDLLRRLSSCLDGLASPLSSDSEDQKFLGFVVWFCSTASYDLNDEDVFPPL